MSVSQATERLSMWQAAFVVGAPRFQRDPVQPIIYLLPARPPFPSDRLFACRGDWRGGGGKSGATKDCGANATTRRPETRDCARAREG